MKHTKLRGYTLILTSAVLFGTYGVWSRLMGDSFPPFYQAWVRSLLILLIMTPFMLRSGAFQKIKRADWPAVAVFVAFCVFTQVPLYFAFNNAPIGAVQLIFYATFVVTAYVVGRFYLAEAMTKIKVFSMLLAFVGLAIVFGSTALTFVPLGLGLAMLNGVASGGEVASSKKIEKNYAPSLIVFLGWAFTLLTHLPVSLLREEPQVVPSLETAWLWLGLYACVNAVAFWLVIAGFRYVDASIGSLIGLSEIVFAILFGALIFHESLSVAVWAGGLLIVVAGMLPDALTVIGKRAKFPQSREL